MQGMTLDTEKGRLVTYPVPPRIEGSTDFSVEVNGVPVFVYPARVSAMPFNQVWRGYQRPLEQTELASFAAFDFSGRVEVRVEAEFQLFYVDIRPKSYGIKPRINGQVVEFTLDRPGQITVELNGMHKALHLFANPLEENIPDPQDPRVHYFGPGVHQVGKLTVGSDETVYIAGGAVVYGAVEAENACNVVVRGRGILDGSRFSRFDIGGLISFMKCENVRVEGIMLRDPNVWTVVPINCSGVHISNVKLVGLWRYNADGIDIVNCQDVVIEDSFVRAFDDCLVFKGLQGFFHHKVERRNLCHVRVERCVIWNDWGRGLELGAETCCDEMYDIVFRDCDILHFCMVACDIQAGDGAYVHDVTFEDIRVEEALDPLVDARLMEIILNHTEWSKDSFLGRVSDVVLRNIGYSGRTIVKCRFIGHSEENDIRNVLVENLTRHGVPVTGTDDPILPFEINEYVRDIKLT